MTTDVTFERLLGILNETFAGLPDLRKGKNKQYTMQDAALSAFSVFFMQSASFLAHQQALQDREKRNNAATLFGITRIPSDPQVRNLLDGVTPEALSAPFWAIFRLLTATALLAPYRSVAGQWLVVLDGTQYFASSKVHCKRCTVKVRNGAEYYAPTAITPVLVAPDLAAVVALEPEFIQPQDGHEKQVCERNAAKRWLARNGAHLAGQTVTLLGDDLYCNQPFCEQVLAQGLNFLFTCKPDSHPTVTDEVESLTRLGGVQTHTVWPWTGQTHEIWTYRYVNDVLFRATADALLVNWCELTIVDAASGQTCYHNAFATNHRVTADNVAALVAAGRARRKIENENNNVLKHYGYHLEHNFGHGEQYLSMILVLLNLLAFLCHTALDLCDPIYHRVQDHLRVRKTFFQDVSTLTHYLVFDSWDHLLHFMYVKLELDQSTSTRGRRKR